MEVFVKGNKPDAVICCVCHALIAGNAAALQQSSSVLIEFANCGRHVAGRWDKRVTQPVKQEDPK